MALLGAYQLPAFSISFNCKVRLTTLFAAELVRSVLANELYIALVTAPPTDSKLTVVPFAETRVCAVFCDAHAAAQKEQVTLEDFANDEWDPTPTKREHCNPRHNFRNRS